MKLTRAVGVHRTAVGILCWIVEVGRTAAALAVGDVWDEAGKRTRAEMPNHGLWMITVLNRTYRYYCYVRDDPKILKSAQERATSVRKGGQQSYPTHKGLQDCRNNTRGGEQILNPFCRPISNRQVKRIRNRCETAGKTKDHRPIISDCRPRPDAGTAGMEDETNLKSPISNKDEESNTIAGRWARSTYSCALGLGFKKGPSYRA